MGLIEQEIKELRQMNRDLQHGNINAEQASARIAIYSQTEKRTRLILQAYSLSAKHGGKYIRRMVTANLIGDGEAIDTVDGDQENEKIKCPAKDFELISRHECLDSSGSQEFPECPTCEHINITRKRLIPSGK